MGDGVNDFSIQNVKTSIGYGWNGGHQVIAAGGMDLRSAGGLPWYPQVAPWYRQGGVRAHPWPGMPPPPVSPPQASSRRQWSPTMPLGSEKQQATRKQDEVETKAQPKDANKQRPFRGPGEDVYKICPLNPIARGNCI